MICIKRIKIIYLCVANVLYGERKHCKQPVMCKTTVRGAWQ